MAVVLVGALVAGCAKAQTIDQLEVLNDGPSRLAIIAPLTVYGDGTQPNTPVVAKGKISFYPKRTWNWRLLMGPPSNFHILDRYGAPCTPYNIWDDAHKTSSSGWIAVAFMNCALLPGDSTWLVADDAPGNAVIIDAR
jgi:hypothetical protein